MEVAYLMASKVTSRRCAVVLRSILLLMLLLLLEVGLRTSANIAMLL